MGKMVMPNRVGLGLGWPNPKLGLGFMNPIWVESGPNGMHPKNASIRGRPTMGANDNQVGAALGYLNP